MRAQKIKRSQRIGHMPGGLGPSLRRQRFRKNEIAVKSVGEAEDCGGPERKTKVHVPEIPADGGANDKAETESGADYAEGLGAFFRRSDISDVSEGRGDV